METVHHKVILESERAFGGRIPPAVCGNLLRHVDREVRSAVSMAFRGASSAVGRPPSWLTAASDIRLVDLEGSGETILHFEAPTFGAAAPELYEQRELWPSRPAADLTGFELLADVVRDVRAENAESDRFDAPFLRRIAGFQSLVGQGIRSARLEDVRVASRDSARLDALTANAAKALAARAPAARPIKIAGRLDMLRVSTGGFEIELDSSERVRGFFGEGDLETLRDLLGARVLVDGRAVYRPSGRLLRVDADLIQRGEGIGEFFSRVPAPLSANVSPGRFRKPQTPTTGMNAIFGRWPGDESDEELSVALEELS